VTPGLIFFSYLGYTLLLFAITFITARRADNRAFFIGNKASPWFVVAYGMIGASLSGVTFISIPGWVGTTQFTYMMVVLGYLIGYTVIATVLMPLYYRLNLTSIYSYLEQRFGFWSYKTGAFYFLLSRTIGASFRIFLVVNVLQVFVFDAWGISFVWTSVIFIILILLYTLRGGVKTIIWTDTLQTTFMLAAVILSIHYISREMGLGIGGLLQAATKNGYTTMVETGWQSRSFFLKQILSGAFIAIVMTGLDQEMMQKNLSCRTLRDAQKNMFSFSFILVFVNLMFLFLGAVLYLYAGSRNIPIPSMTDDLFPTLSLDYLSPFTGLVFMIGLISAAYPSADGALTALTTSFSIDFLGFNKRSDLSEKKKMRIRYGVHTGFALLLLIVIVLFKAINDRAVIDRLFTIAGYTYGPLLGLYAFGLFTRHAVKDRWVPLIALASPLICFLLSMHSESLMNGYKFGFELLVLNGAITFILLLFFKKKPTPSAIS
jgi:Na+/proline symporter